MTAVNFCACGCGQTAKRRFARGHNSRTNRLSGTPTYVVWEAIQQRCLNPNNPAYPQYGGRGITVCQRWLGRPGFQNFLADMGERPGGTSIDRIDNEGNYQPDNCRWATPVEQRANQRPHRARAKRTHCFRGHPLEGDNLIVHAHGGRQCRECRNAANRKREKAQREARSS